MPAYDETFWRRVTARYAPVTLSGALKRIVENQTQVVTLSLVDSLDEQLLLEQMLEDAKPPLPANTGKPLDYLLASPWRYPPLPWGSRFGRRFEPSIFYGSLSEDALFAEAAWYRWVFLAGPEQPFAGRVISQHTVFEARYHSEAGADLCAAPFDAHRRTLTHRRDYVACQALGSVLREKGFAAFSYWSARSLTAQKNIGLLEPAALRSRKPARQQQWLCEALPEQVSFRCGDRLFRFLRDDFLAPGEQPLTPS